MRNSFQPNEVTFIVLLSACADSANITIGRQVHQQIQQCKLISVPVQTALIHMYSKCGFVLEAEHVFWNFTSADVVYWTAMINGYGVNGDGNKALQLYHQMLEKGIQPTAKTFTAILNACSHAGLVEDAKQVYHDMPKFGINPDMYHSNCLVDVLARSGKIKEAEQFALSLPHCDQTTWMAVLGACRTGDDIPIAERAAAKLLEKNPHDASIYVTLANVYAHAGNWDGQQRVRQMMDEKGVKKIPGVTTIEVNGTVHRFTVSDDSHPESKQIFQELEKLVNEIKSIGYKPDLKWVLHNIGDETKEQQICLHSEKLAIAYGLTKIADGPIVIVKNLRVCGDCHEATKFISKARNREIIVRDTSRFHHFKNGQCSCHDHW